MNHFNQNNNYYPQNQSHKQPIPQWESLQPEQASQLVTRNAFLRKVFTIVTIQMFLSTIISVILYHCPDFQREYGTLSSLIGSSLLLEVFCVIISCSQNFLVKYPFPLLIIFTCFKSFVLSMATSVQKSTNILNSLWISTLSMVFLTVYVYSCKRDLKSCLVYGFAVAQAMVCYRLCIWLNHSSSFSAFWVSLWAFISTSWLINDSQNMLEKRKNNDESWSGACACAVTLYLDILCLLRCLKKVV